MQRNIEPLKINEVSRIRGKERGEERREGEVVCDIWVFHITPVCLGSPSPPPSPPSPLDFNSHFLSLTRTHMQTETHSWTRGVGLHGGGGGGWGGGGPVVGKD